MELIWPVVGDAVQAAPLLMAGWKICCDSYTTHFTLHTKRQSKALENSLDSMDLDKIQSNSGDKRFQPNLVIDGNVVRLFPDLLFSIKLILQCSK